MIDVTILRVERKDKNSKRVWRIKECNDKSLINVLTTCGVPGYAGNFPIGTTYTKILFIPERKKK